jgi:hypothetical protein
MEQLELQRCSVRGGHISLGPPRPGLLQPQRLSTCADGGNLLARPVEFQISVWIVGLATGSLTARAWAAFCSGLASGSNSKAGTPARLLCCTISFSATSEDTTLSGSCANCTAASTLASGLEKAMLEGMLANIRGELAATTYLPPTGPNWPKMMSPGRRAA